MKRRLYLNFINLFFWPWAIINFLFTNPLFAQSPSLKELASNYRNDCFPPKNADGKEIVEGDKRSCVALGEIYWEQNSGEAALSAFSEGCKNKNYFSCMRVGDYLSEKGSKAEAKNYYASACNAGVRDACSKIKRIDEAEFELLFYASLILICIAVFIVARTIFLDEDQFKTSEKLEEASSSVENLAQYGIVLKYSRPFFRRYFSPIISGMKNKKMIRDRYQRRLATAGLNSVLRPDDFFAFKLFLIIGFPIVFLIIRTFLEENWSLGLIPIIAAVGFIYPDIWVKGRIQERQKQILMAMPFAVDMLALSVEAGLDFMAAITKVVEKAKKNPLTEEFEQLVREIRIGSSRAEALRGFAWRIDMIQVSSFSATLIAADSVGASIGPILKSLSEEIRQKKSAEVEKAGAKAATKILFPMLGLIVPAVFIVVGAPIILEFLGGGGGS